MSDYIENQDYSMQLAAPEDDPFAYDWATLREEVDEPLSALFADITPTSLQEPIDLNSNQWSGMSDTLEKGPWRDIFHWSADDQGAEAQPVDQKADFEFIMTSEQDAQVHNKSEEVERRFVCSHSKCTKAYRRKGDLSRHQKSHESRQLLCTTQECRYSFARADKLRDHIRAGHDEETLFACSASECQALLTKDILPFHGPKYDNVFLPLRDYRQCPLPKCGFRVNIRALDGLQQHLLKSHDLKGRERFASLIADKGYDCETAHIICPVCSSRTLFSTHIDFEQHVLDNHCGPYEPYTWEKPLGGAWTILVFEVNRLYTTIPEELREHRRILLSVWPKCSDVPVWSDIRKCPT